MYSFRFANCILIYIIFIIYITNWNYLGPWNSFTYFISSQREGRSFETIAIALYKLVDRGMPSLKCYRHIMARMKGRGGGMALYGEILCHATLSKINWFESFFQFWRCRPENLHTPFSQYTSCTWRLEPTSRGKIVAWSY